MKDMQKELESLRKQVALLEELVALRAKADDLTRQLAPQVPYYPPVYPQPYPIYPYPVWSPALPLKYTCATATQTVTGLKEGSVSSTYILDDMRNLGWSNTANGPEA